MHMDDVHGLEQAFGGAVVAERQVEARVLDRQPRRADDARLVVAVFEIAEGEDEDVVSGAFQVAFVQVNVIGDPADVRLVGVGHHSDAHGVAPILSLCESFTLLYTLPVRHILIYSY